jgi:outer membrane protein insertion porin family
VPHWSSWIVCSNSETCKQTFLSWCVEVPNGLDSMRFSPVLLAVVAASTTLGLAHPAKAEATNPDQLAESDSPEITTAEFDGDLNTQLSLNELEGSFNADKSADEQIAAESEGFTVDFLSQVPPSETPTNVPLDAPAPQVPLGSETPTEETPNQLQFQLDQSPDLDVPTEVPDDAPAPEPAPEVETEPIAPDAEVDEPATTPDPDSPVQESPTPTAPATPPTTDQPEAEPRVLVSEVLVVGAEGDLQNEVYRVIRTQPGQTTTRSQLQEDINAIFATGFFSSVRAVPEDTPLGVRVTFDVAPNPVLESVQLSGNVLETIVYNEEEVPLQTAVDDIFSPQYGQILNLRDLQVGVEQLNQLYQDNGYVLAQVVGAPQISPDGVVTLEVAEGVIEDIQIRFLNRDGEAEDDEGEPIEGRTRDFIITREFESQPGDVFNQQQIQADLQRAFGLGIFEDLNISLNPGQDPRQVDVVVNVTERNTGSFAAGIGISSASGFFGTASFQEQNLGGNNQRLNAELQIGSRDLLFDISFTDPWIGGDPNRTSYTVNAFGRQSRSLVFEGDDEDIRLPNGDRPRVRRFGGGVTFGRPLDDGWRVSLGAQYQRISIRDLDGDLEPRSEFGTPFSFSDSGQDDLFTVQFTASRDQRNNPLQPTSGSFLRLSTEQSIPIGNGSIFLNRLRASYSYFLPVRFTNFTEGCRLEDPSPVDCPQALAFNVQGGTILGDLPPYEAFSLGGTDSVRGYGAGELASGRSFLQATVEYRFPVFAIVSGALFADVGTDLGTGDDIPGNPSEILNKPGTGFGYGVGVRVQSPLGQIRVDYAINDEGDSQIHFGIGERF